MDAESKKEERERVLNLEQTQNDLRKRMEDFATTDFSIALSADTNITEMLVGRSGRMRRVLESFSSRKNSFSLRTCCPCFFASQDYSCSNCSAKVGDVYFECLDCEEDFVLCEKCEDKSDVIEQHGNGMHNFGKIRK